MWTRATRIQGAYGARARSSRIALQGSGRDPVSTSLPEAPWRRLAPMRALRIVHVDAEKGFSGGEVQVFLLIEGLRERGHEGTLLCPPGSLAESRARERKIPVRTVRMGSDLDLAAVAGLRRELEDLAPDLVHLHTGRAPWLGGLAARTRGLPGRRDDAADLLAGCDFLVLPSRREGLGVSALEAMAARRPVVASRVGGLADAVVDGRTGLLVEPENPAALAQAVARLAADADLRRNLGEAGPGRLAEGFLASQMVAAYEKLYRSVLEERKKA